MVTKEDLIAHGIVPGARIKDAIYSGDEGIVNAEELWELTDADNWVVGHADNGTLLYAYAENRFGIPVEAPPPTIPEVLAKHPEAREGIKMLHPEEFKEDYEKQFNDALKPLKALFDGMNAAYKQR